MGVTKKKMCHSHARTRRCKNMNRELKMLLIELLKREDEITDDEFFYDAEYRSLIKMLDEILSNDL